MEEKIVKSDTWRDWLLHPFYAAKNFLHGKAFIDDIKSKLKSESEKNSGSGQVESNNFDARVTGACEIMIPGVGFECQTGLTDPQCTRIILEAQKSNRGIWGKFRPGGQCSR